MKSILVPSDFSECAGFAMEAAVLLARRFEARVHLLTCLDIPEHWTEMSPAEKEKWPGAKELIAEAEEKLQDRKRRFPDVRIQTSWSGRRLAAAVDKYIKSNGIEFVIMGSHGASGKSEFFIGSNTQRVVRMVHCPVLVVKNHLADVNFDQVVFASSFNEEEKGPFLKFKEIIRHFIPEIHLVAIHTSSFFDPPAIVSYDAMEDFKALCQPFPCKIHIFRDLTVEQGIRSFSEATGASLIGINNHQRHPLKRMLVGSKVEALINHASIPVLSIDYE